MATEPEHKITPIEWAEVLGGIFSSYLWPFLDKKAPQFSPVIYAALFLHFYAWGEVVIRTFRLTEKRVSIPKIFSHDGTPIRKSTRNHWNIGLRVIVAGLSLVASTFVWKYTVFDSYPYLAPFITPRDNGYVLDFTLNIESQIRKTNIHNLQILHTDITDVSAYNALEKKYGRHLEGEESWPAVSNLAGEFSRGQTHIFTDRRVTPEKDDPFRLPKKMSGVRMYTVRFPTETGSYYQELYISRSSNVWDWSLAVWRDNEKKPIKTIGDFTAMSEMAHATVPLEGIKRENPSGRPALIILGTNDNP